MPPRKSNVSTVSNGAEDGAETAPAKGAKDGISVEDLSLPKSMVARLAKGVLPANTQIHKDALLALHKSATVFVNYIASTSFENAQLSNKKTIMPPDVVAALKDAEFEGFLPRLEAELKKYNDIQCDKRNTYRRKVKEDKAAVPTPDAEGGEAPATAAAPAVNGTSNGHVEDDEERPAKKQKGEEGDALPPDEDPMEEDVPDGEQENVQDDADQEEEEEEEVDEDSYDDEARGNSSPEEEEGITYEELNQNHANQMEYARMELAGELDDDSDSD